MKQFSGKITEWYRTHKRDLPWRNTSDPYLIWLSEIILQQTRVDQGMSYYLKFSSEFPTVSHLAKANNDKVMKLWQGLGYYSRARNLHAAAKTVAADFKGEFPSGYTDLLSLKGVGEYTAAAIASFAFNKPYAVVDGNVYRVLSRVFGIETPIDSTLGKKQFSELAQELLSKKDPGNYNQAIMEFGAIQCKPVNPDCENCPLNNMCYAFAKKKVAELPVKAKKTKVRNRYFNYIVLNHKGTTAIKKRTEKDIWINLHDFPLFETDQQLSEDQFLRSADWKKFIGKINYSVRTISDPYKHILSHQHIFARFIEIDCDKSFQNLISKPLILIKRKDIHKYAVSRLMENYLEGNQQDF
jgi:A/G-specific adenine glycosylase